MNNYEIYIIIPAKLSISELRKYLLDNLFDGKSELISIPIDRDAYFFSNKMFIEFPMLGCEEVRFDYIHKYSHILSAGFNEYIHTDFIIDLLIENYIEQDDHIVNISLRDLNSNCVSEKEFIDMSVKWYRDEIESLFVYEDSYNNTEINSMILENLMLKYYDKIMSYPEYS